MTKSISKKSAKARQLSRGVIKTVAGMSLTSPKDLVRLAAHAGDELLKGHFSKALFDTYVYFINNGEIESSYLDSTKLADLAPEFKTIQESSFSIDKLDHLRRIFVNLAKDKNPEGYRKYLLDIALEMSEAEIKVILAEFQLGKTINKQEDATRLRNQRNWVAAVVANSKLKHDQLVYLAEKKLIERGLVEERLLSDRSGTTFELGRGRLTSMGQELCVLMLLEDDPIS